MTRNRFFRSAALVFLAITVEAQQNQTASPVYNTAKEKLKAGKQLVGATITSPDPNIYCAIANSGFDFTWIEMQHSPLTYEDAARLIWACRGSAATPIIRVPDATESDIQKAMDIGALGIAVPQVETVEKTEAAVKWAKFPPQGHRSTGLGQATELYGPGYHASINNNMLMIIMIESPAGVDNVEKIASVPGVDLIYVASNDLGQFSGYREGQPQYESLVKRIHDVTLTHHLFLGGPPAWKEGRPGQGYSFFVGPSEAQLLRTGAQVILKHPVSAERGGRN
jgi:2-keto-3-deoxy-L-rhamnonate aldolase RhmA